MMVEVSRELTDDGVVALVILEGVEMEPVPLALAPQAEGVGGLHRAGDVEIALEHLGEVHNVGDLAALQIDLQHLVLHGLTLQVGGQGQDGALGAPVDVVVQLVLAQVEDLGHLAEAVEPGHLGAAHAGDKAAVLVPQEAVGVVALQHHLVAHDAVVCRRRRCSRTARRCPWRSTGRWRAPGCCRRPRSPGSHRSQRWPRAYRW